MSLFAFLSAMVATAALFAWVNHRFIRLPTTIGVMLVSLGMSLGLLVMDVLGLHVREPVEDLLERYPFDDALLDVMLAFLLFAGALHVQLEDLMAQKWVVALLATAGVLVTTFLVGGMVYVLAGVLGLPLGLLSCLVFGALIAPTDPIAVLAILKDAGAPPSVATKITGESLFNDGIGVVVFSVLAALAAAELGGAGALAAGLDGTAAGATAASGAVEAAHATPPLDVLHVAGLLAQEVVGAVLLGLAGGWLCFRLLLSIEDHQTEVLLTLALAMGLYALASAVHSSGPLAVVVAGLFIGNSGRRLAMSDSTREHLDTFWELVDGILNVLLFVLIGMEVLVIHSPWVHVLAGAAAIPLVLLARWISVAGVVGLLRHRRPFTPHAVAIMTWGGLRGGISIALVLSLPSGPVREVLLTITYVVVVFSIAVQGLTIGPLLKRLLGPAPAARP